MGAVGTITSGRGADLFNVSETQPGGDTFTMTLDGGKGDDTYLFHVNDGGARIDAQVTDNGDPWNSGDVIVVDGAAAADQVKVTSDRICTHTLGNPVVPVTCSATDDSIRYTSPAFDANVLRVLVNGNGGDDRLTVESTSGTVPVKVDGGAGNDLITVGNASNGLNDIVGISRPNVNQPDGVGPVAIVGGSGHDTLIVDDSADSSANTGRLTSFREKRPGAPAAGDEVGIVTGLGMKLYPSGAAFNASTGAGAGRVEFEGVESVDVKLSGGADTFAVGGDAGLLGTGADALPLGRQALILGFTSTPSATVTVEAGGGNDTVRVFGTGVYDRDILNATGYLNVVTIADGIPDISGEEQVLYVPAGVFGYFTLTFGASTTPLLSLGASLGQIQSALQALSPSYAGKILVSTSPDAPGQFVVDFDRSLGDVVQLVATLTPKISSVTGGQLLEMPTGAVGVGFFTLTDGVHTTAALPMDATPGDIGSALTAGGFGAGITVVGAAGKFTIGSAPTLTGAKILPLLVTTPGTGDHANQTLTIPTIAYGTGYFTLQYDYQETKPLPMTASAADIRDALAALQLLDTHQTLVYNLDVTASAVTGGTQFAIHFHTGTIGTAAVLVARLVPLLVDTGAGNDNLRVQATFEQLFYRGGAGNDNVALSIDALSLQPLTQAQVHATATAAVVAGDPHVQRITFANVTGGQFALTYGAHTTAAFGYDAAPELLAAAILSLVQFDVPSATGEDVAVMRIVGGYEIHFQNALASAVIGALGVSDHGTDSLTGQPYRLLSNGLAAVVTVDGQGGSDIYTVNLIGGRTASLINVFDTGGKLDGTDTLTVNGTTNPDFFLLRAATAESGLAFIALINAADPHAVAATDPVERVNYNIALESIKLFTITNSVVSTGDQVYVDDTRAIIEIHGGDGPDFFQVGQLYHSRRTPRLAGVAAEDVFATIETTKGWLSNGITNPMTIFGGEGNDTFIVFHNLAVLGLNGEGGDDTFLVQAFALAGSQDDFRAVTDLSGGAGADLIQYAVNAPVNIDGGDGFDTVIVIGTEFGDDFVVTKDGVFGAGLNVNFVNIESLEVDGGAGDDRFFVLSTGITFKTTITGGLGTDLISVQGPTPGNGVISNDLLGHSGIITHDVEQTAAPEQYSGLKVIGISANVVDNDTPGIMILQSNGYSQVVEGAPAGQQGVDSYIIVLARPPNGGSYVVVTAVPPRGLVLLDPITHTPIRVLSNTEQLITLAGVTDGTFTLGDGTHTTAGIAYNAAAGDVQTALTNASITGVTVTQDGPTYTLVFDGGSYVHTDVPLLLLDDSQLTGGAASILLTQHGGVSIAGGLSYCFDSGDSACPDPGNEWYKARTVEFAVDDAVPDIPATGDILNRIVVSDAGGSSIVGHVNVADSFDSDTLGHIGYPTDEAEDTNPLPGGDQYATVSVGGTETNLFAAYLPTEQLPEGIRGAYLKITGGDLEASGQIRLILGSYIETIDVSAASGPGSFTLTAAGDESTAIAYGSDVSAAIQAALVALLGQDAVTVTKTGTDTYRVELGSNLYLGWDGSAGVAGIGVKVSGVVGAGTIDANTIKLNAPWSVIPEQYAQFEILLYSAVQVPNVRVKIFTTQTPAVVVDETHGSTTVSETPDSISAADAIANGLVDTILVRLSADPLGSIAVALENANGQLRFYDSAALTHEITSLSFDSTTWGDFQTVWVKGIADGVVENFHKADLKLSAGGYRPYALTVDVGDANYPGVRVLETDGATTVAETTTQFGVAEGSTGLPLSDTYTIALTQAPTAGTVTVTATAQPTRASQTGGIVSFSQQVVLCNESLEDCTNPANYHDHVDVTFDGTNWYLPQTVHVRARGNDRVDGMDTKVFAPTLDLLNNIQGPLFVNGGEGDDRTGLLEREPLMLPRERNLKPAMGAIVSAAEGSGDGVTPATVTIDPGTILPPSQTSVATIVGGGSGVNEQQLITINAIGGHFTLGYGLEPTDPLPYNASALQMQLALKALPALSGITITVAKNSNQFYVTFHDGANKTQLTAASDVSDPLQPLTPDALVNYTLEVTSGPAKNKVRIVKSAVDNGDGTWTLTLDHLWYSPFGDDASTPSPDPAHPSTYTLYATNPNLLVDEKTSTDILWLYDGNNPGSYDDAAYRAAHAGADNPFATGSLSYSESTDYGRNGDPLNQFRIQGFGMGSDRVIAEGTSGEALQPGGVTFKDIENLQLNLGPGNNIFTIDNTPPGAHVTVNTGDGNDKVYVNAISGYTAVNLGGGQDELNVDQQTQTLAALYGLLTVSGDIPQAVVTNLVNGSPRQGTAVDPVNAIQRIVVEATGGVYSLTVSDGSAGYTTSDIAWDADASTVAGAINTAFGVNGHVSVRKAGHTYFVTFDGATAAMPIPLIVAHDLGLTNGADSGDTLNVYDNNASANDSVLLTSSSLSGLDTPQPNEIQQIVVDATSGSFTVSYDGGAPITVAYGTSAATLEQRLQTETAIGLGNVAVALMDDVYVLRFQGALSNLDVPQVVVDGSGLLKRRDPLGGCTVDASGLVQVGCAIDDPGSATATTRHDGFALTADPTNQQAPFAIDDTQVLTIAATSGTYTLSLLLPHTTVPVTTAAIAYDATGDVVRQALQDAIVANDPRLRFKFDVLVDRYRDGLNQLVYVIGFVGNLRQTNDGPGANFLQVGAPAGFAYTLATRMDGFEYFGVEYLNVDTGSGADVLSVQGTSAGSNGFTGAAVTNVNLHNGDDRVFVSSNADQDLNSWQNVDFLTGNLDDVRGALNVDLGSGRHKLFVSDEASSHADWWTITDTTAGRDIAIDRTPPAPVSYGTTPITYTAASDGNLYDGVTYWTGSGDDHVTSTAPTTARRAHHDEPEHRSRQRHRVRRAHGRLGRLLRPQHLGRPGHRRPVRALRRRRLRRRRRGRLRLVAAARDLRRLRQRHDPRRIGQRRHPRRPRPRPVRRPGRPASWPPSSATAAAAT